jgi:hypothetical protein
MEDNGASCGLAAWAKAKVGAATAAPAIRPRRVKWKLMEVLPVLLFWGKLELA